MNSEQKKPTDAELEKMRERRIEAMHLQEIENNPLDDEQIAMFEMFERERWTDEQCKEYLEARVKARRDRLNT